MRGTAMQLPFNLQHVMGVYYYPVEQVLKVAELPTPDRPVYHRYDLTEGGQGVREARIARKWAQRNRVLYTVT